MAGVTVELPELVAVPRCDDDVACFCVVGHDSRHLRVRVHRQAAATPSDAFVPTVLPAPILGEGVNEKFASIVLSYRRVTTGVPSMNGNHDCKMTMLGPSSLGVQLAKPSLQPA